MELLWDIVSLGRVPGTAPFRGQFRQRADWALLVSGGDLPTVDSATLAYFTCEEAMAIDQHSRRSRAHAPGARVYKVSPAK